MEDSEIEAFGVEFAEDDRGLSVRDLLDPAILASFISVESGASSNVSCEADACQQSLLGSKGNFPTPSWSVVSALEAAASIF